MVLVLVVAYLGNYGFAHAADSILHGLDTTGLGAGYKEVSVTNIVSNGLGGALALISIAILLLLIYGGTRWMIARGNAEDVTKAKDIIEQALIGLVIILGAWGLASFVFNRLKKQPISEALPEIPHSIVVGNTDPSIVGICVCRTTNECSEILSSVYPADFDPATADEASGDPRQTFCDSICGSAIGIVYNNNVSMSNCIGYSVSNLNPQQETAPAVPPPPPLETIGSCHCDAGFGPCINVDPVAISFEDSGIKCWLDCSYNGGVRWYNGEEISTGEHAPIYHPGESCP